jgi:starch synthase
MAKPSSKKLRILFATMEADPFVKAGGLADVARALPLVFHEMGHDVRIVMPHHYMPDEDKLKFKSLVKKTSVQMDEERINFSVNEATLDGKVPVYFIDNKGFFRSRRAVYGYVDDVTRFAFLCKAMLKVPELIDWKPDIVHSNDWHTGLVSNYLKTFYADSPTYDHARTVFTIHNLAYQGTFNRLTLLPEEIDSGGELPKYNTPQFNTVNFMKRGILYSDAITTVSKQYAKEITSESYGEGLDTVIRERRNKLVGIVNGVDYKKFNPATDPSIAQTYSWRTPERKVENKIALQKELGLTVDPDIPLIGIASRFTSAKGFDLIVDVLDYLLGINCQLAIVGEGDENYHNILHEHHKRHPRKFAAYLKFDREMASKIYAGSDLYLMPSKHEPCGISQLISSRYGSVPIVRATGGLIDTITDYKPETGEGNGFVFDTFDPIDMFHAIVRALEDYRHKKSWSKLIINVMRLEFSWERAAEIYLDVYKQALEGKEEIHVNGEAKK